MRRRTVNTPVRHVLCHMKEPLLCNPSRPDIVYVPSRNVCYILACPDTKKEYPPPLRLDCQGISNTEDSEGS